MNQAMKDCIDACERCHRTCAAHEGVDRAQLAPDHLLLMRDCAEICETAANFMLAGSPYHQEVCALCAEICLACADRCDELDMQQCVEACRHCAESCRKMAVAVG
jgi:hypothetical protein